MSEIKKGIIQGFLIATVMILFVEFSLGFKIGFEIMWADFVLYGLFLLMFCLLSVKQHTQTKKSLQKVINNNTKGIYAVTLKVKFFYEVEANSALHACEIVDRMSLDNEDVTELDIVANYIEDYD